MPLTPLAVPADLPSKWQDHADAERALESAASAIRDAAETTITRETSTVIVNGDSGHLLRLPGPVVSVASVLVDGTEISDYLPQGNGLWRACGWASCGRPVPITVAYTHGLVDVPADIVDLCTALAVAWLEHRQEGGGSTAGLKSARLDDAAEGYTDADAEQITPVYVPTKTAQWLARRFGGGAEVVGTL